MEKVLILSCNTGQGHNSCAKAIEEYFKKQGVDCQTRDALGFISERISDFISWGHSWVYRYIPGLFRFGYYYSENHPGLFHPSSKVYKFLTTGTERLYTYIAENQFDTVICTHVFSAMILTNILEKHPLDIRTAFVATDYTCSPSTEASNLEHYFIPDTWLLEDYAKHGIPMERMTATGIPVRSDFEKHVEKADAKRLLDIDVNHKHLLIMGGSMGCGPIPKMVYQIAKSMTPDIEVSVICGANHILQKSLEKLCFKNEHIHIVGYTNQMSLYLDSADLYLTKPGGISVTEAASKNMPMALVNAVAGCESYNMKFFLDRGAAITASSPRKLAKECIRVLNSPDERQHMEQALVEYHQPNGAAYIFREISKGALA